MKVVVEFDMVDMSMHKHETFFRHILKRYGAGVRSIKIIEPDERPIERIPNETE
jgi:hypothetical protein